MAYDTDDYEYVTHADWEDEAWIFTVDGETWYAETSEGDLYVWDEDEELDEDGWFGVEEFEYEDEYEEDEEVIELDFGDE